MKNQGVLYGILGLIVGVTVTGAAMSMPKSNSSMPGGSSMTMDDMMKGLEGKSGDEFDKTFLDEMVQHHEGAINMAKEALTNAKHEEIKTMANDIVTTQTREIDQMKAWQRQWGY